MWFLRSLGIVFVSVIALMFGLLSPALLPVAKLIPTYTFSESWLNTLLSILMSSLVASLLYIPSSLLLIGNQVGDKKSRVAIRQGLALVVLFSGIWVFSNYAPVPRPLISVLVFLAMYTIAVSAIVGGSEWKWVQKYSRSKGSWMWIAGVVIGWSIAVFVSMALVQGAIGP